MADFTAVVTILIANIHILHFNITYNIMNDKRNVKRLLVFIACFVLTFGASRLNAAKVILNGNLSDYKYAYVIPTSSITSSAGGSGVVFGNHYGMYGTTYEAPTRTISPSEKIAGSLMKFGYTILPQISQEYGNQTIIVSYGYLEGGVEDDIFIKATATILIQIRDALTQNLIASFETTGYGQEEAEAISDAINSALTLFKYSLAPKVTIKFEEVLKNYFFLSLTNETPDNVNNVIMGITYYLNGEKVEEQRVQTSAKILWGETQRIKVKRPKSARSRKMQIKVDVLDYN